MYPSTSPVLAVARAVFFMARPYHAKGRGLTALGALLLACGPTLPPEAQPRPGLVDVAQIDAAETIRYRALTRADFRGRSMPPQFGGDPSLLAAATCVYIRPAPALQIATRPSGDGQFEAQVRNVAFTALMDRGCSWWNPQQLTPTEYVLQHEQIHFAIFEVHARRMNASAEAIGASTSTFAETEAAARAGAEAKFLTLLRDHQDAVTRRNLLLDQETSVGHDARAQQHWYEQLQQELRETAR
jgi:hypothetical protein